MPRIAVSIKAESRYCVSGMTVQNRSEYSDAAAAVSGAYKDDDSKYSLKNLLKRQETEAGNEE